MPYVRPTFDTSLKYVFMDKNIRKNFFCTFLPRLPIISSEFFNADQYLPKNSKKKYDGTIDFMCRCEDGNFALVEIQAIPDFYPADRSVFCAAKFHRQQLSETKNPKKIKEIIRIGILGGETDQQIDPFSVSICGIKLSELTIMTPTTLPTDKAKRDWINFFRAGPHTSEDWVRNEITTPTVKAAFRKIRFDNLPAEIRRAYIAEGKSYKKFWNDKEGRATEFVTDSLRSQNKDRNKL